MTFPALACREHHLNPDRLGWLEPVPEYERHDRNALWSRLERDGYLFLRGLLTREASEEFRRHYFTALEPSGLLEPGSDPVDGIASSSGEIDHAEARRAIFEEVVPGQTYEAFCTADALRGFFAWLYGSDVHLHKRKLIRHARVGEGWVTPAHYDLVYLREGTDNLLSAWIPLGDCPVTNGGLCYLERSHVHFKARDAAEGGALRAQHITYDLNSLTDDLETRWLVADYAAGDVVVHSPYMVHASLNNTDPNRRMRLSTDIRYQRSGDAIDARWQSHWSDTDGL
jgi:hypothetical protein